MRKAIGLMVAVVVSVVTLTVATALHSERAEAYGFRDRPCEVAEQYYGVHLRVCD